MRNSTVISINIRLEIPGDVKVTLEQLEERDTGIGGPVVAKAKKPDPDPPGDAEVIQEQAPPQGQELPDGMTAADVKEKIEAEDEPVDGMSREEAEKEAAAQAQYEKEACGALHGEKMTEEEAKAFFRRETEGSVRQEFFDLAKRKFANEADALAFSDTILGTKKTPWTTDEYRTLIKEASDLADYVTGEKPQETGAETGEELEEFCLEDQVTELLNGYDGNIHADYASLLFSKFPAVADRGNWVRDTFGKSREESWTNENFAKGIILLRRLPEVEEESSPGDNLAPIITGVTYDAITKLVDASKKFPMMRSKVFRDWAKAIIGHPYRAFKKIREHEGQKILAALQKEEDAVHEELAAGLGLKSAEGEFVDDDPLNQGEVPDAGDGILTDEQYDEIVDLVDKMPDRFRMGAEAVRQFIKGAIRQTDQSFVFDGIKNKLTKKQGDIVIAAQKNYIKPNVR